MRSPATEHLIQEHHHIRHCLDAVEAFTTLVERVGHESETVDRHELCPFLDYLIEVLMLRHEEKEETVLLPELQHLGFAWGDGPLSHVRRDHRQGRYLVSALRQATHQRSAWTADDLRHFVALSREWLAFNRRHMQLEETVLFPVAAVRIHPVLQETMTARFVAIDHEVDQLPDAQRLTREGRHFLERLAPCMAAAC
jgi:hemerythrin-like domain-containing protein